MSYTFQSLLIIRLLLCGLMLSLPSSALFGQEAASEVSQTDKEAFVKAAATGDIETVKEWIEREIDLDYESQRGLTALQAAKILGYAEVVEALTLAGAEDRPIDSSALARKQLNTLVKPSGPGLAVLIVKGDETLFEFTGGMANIGHLVPVKSSTKFRIGSVTKQFAATAILKLQEEGKLSVDDTIDKYFPGFPRGDEVTIHHLMTHTSGIKSFTSVPTFMGEVSSRVTSDVVVDSFKDEPYDFDPGEKFQYNNSGYFLMGLIVEQVSKKSFADFLRDEIFKPLGMSNTGIHDSEVILSDEAEGYSWIDNQVKKAHVWDMSWAGAAGNIYSTLGDLAKWNQGLFGGKIINQASRNAAFTPVKTADGAPNTYGYGWMIDEYRGLKRIHHSGGLHGFLTQMTYYPDLEVTLVAFHNASPAMPGTTPGRVVDDLAQLFLWSEMSAQENVEVDEEADTTKFADYVGRYDYQAAVMRVTLEDDELFAQLTGQQRFQIFPVAGEPDTFVWKVVKAQVKFLRDDDENVYAARHTQNGFTFDAKRLGEEAKVAEVSPEVLDRYVGKYRYPAIGTLTVRRDGKRLLAKMTGQVEFEIFPTSETKFVWKVVEASIEFHLDDEQQVTGATHMQAGTTIKVEKIADDE